MASGGYGGLQPLTGIAIIQDDAAFATAEERSGGIADPYHGHIGEQDKPYSWESKATPGATHGPYGPENQLLDDAFWFLEPAGYPEQDPDFDRNTPSLTRSHGSVRNVGNSGAAPSQYDAINRQLSQMGNHSSNLGTSKQMQRDQLGLARQDNWHEIWEIDDGHTDAPTQVKQYSHSVFGFGANDTVGNLSRKVNGFGYGSKHMHRRFAWNNIPGNFMWLRPQGRPISKTIAGTAKLPVGPDSQFSAVNEPGNAKDIGFSFDPYGAVLTNTPTEYVPPPAPNIASVTPAYSNEQGTDGFEMW